MSARLGRQRRRPCDGRSVQAVGFRAGYWPCLGAVFFKVDLGPVFVECATGTRPGWWDE